MRWLGIDVGGANLKVSDGASYAASYPFELWKSRDGLPGALAAVFAAAPAADAVAATMTGELADCYKTKADGVRHITQSLEEATASRQLAIYTVDGNFRRAAETLKNPLPAAASNWHALARYAARWLPDQTGVVVDIGSTTTDLIPVLEGDVATRSRTDTDRLLAGELVYTGASRTPVCAIVAALPYRGKMCPVAAELFATSADVYYLLGETASHASHTADGRALTESFSTDRLARQICADRSSFRLEDALAVAHYIHEQQAKLICDALKRVVGRHCASKIDVIVSGSGCFLASDSVTTHPKVDRVAWMSDCVTRELSCSAPAMAVACLAAESESP